MRATLTHPILLVAVALLLLNDHVLKAAYPGGVTGKLSDVAGLLAFAWVLTALLPDRRAWRAWAFVVTGLGFAWFKSAWADGFVEAWSAWAYPIARVVDPTDLWALLVLPLGYRLLGGVGAQNLPSVRPSRWVPVARAGALAVCVFAFAATSDDRWEPTNQVIQTFPTSAVDRDYVVVRTVDDLRRADFVSVADPTVGIPGDSCFLGRFHLNPPEGFETMEVLATARLLPAGDSTLFTISDVQSAWATYATVFYGAISFESMDRAQADFDSIGVDSVVTMLERDVVLRLRIGSPLISPVEMSLCR